MTGGHVPRGQQDDRLVQYLLGELSDEQRDQLETEYFVNSELHAELLALEDELIYAYIGGRLSPTQSASFERFFLQTPERRSRIEFARSFWQFLESNPHLQHPKTAPSLPNERYPERSVSEQKPNASPDVHDQLGAPPKSRSLWID